MSYGVDAFCQAVVVCNVVVTLRVLIRPETDVSLRSEADVTRRVCAVIGNATGLSAKGGAVHVNTKSFDSSGVCLC